MANQLNFQIGQHETNHMMDTGNPQNGNSNYFTPMDTGSANVPTGREINRKLFIGGLSRKTTEEDLRDYFNNSAEAVVQVITEGNHFINNKKVDTEIASSKLGKIFVGGITAELSKEDIKNHFNQFGNVIEVHIPPGRTKKQRKKFCLVILDSEEVAEKLIRTPKVYIKNVEVDVGRATDKSNFGPCEQDIVLPQQGETEFSQNFGQSLAHNSLLLLLLQMFGTYGYGQQVPAQVNNNNVEVTQETGRRAGRRKTARSGRRAMKRANNAGRGNGAGTFNTNFRYRSY